ncbi:MAG: trypsin-like peptidase domain-containing protein [Bacteroidetes bacterium]|nr:trypsin-like peptidase domain-containing protein [Bacteroidota bacterium]
MVISHDYIFAVAGGEMKDGGVNLKQLIGTSFSIGNNFFITANHVITAALSYEVKGLLCFNEQNQAGLFPVEDDNYESFPDYDIAILKVDKIPHKFFPWDFSGLRMLENVMSSGFPFAFDPNQKKIITRCFKGYIVSAHPFYEFVSNPDSYELSFSCPRGISGAPLLTYEEPQKVVGIIIGNKSTEMNVYTEKEIISEEKEVVVERYESIQYGLAIETASIKHVESKLLGTTIEDYINKISND